MAKLDRISCRDMSNIRKSITYDYCSLTFGHQQLILVDFLLKEVDQVIFLLELLVELVDNFFELNVEDFYDILIDALSDIEELDMQGIFELFCPLVVCISQVIDFFQELFAKALNQVCLLSDFALQFLNLFLKLSLFLLLTLNCLLLGITHFGGS